VDPPIRLSPDRTAELRNFGAGRGRKEIPVLIEASDPLPESLSPDQLTLDAPRPFERVGDKLESTVFPLPLFTEPQISGDEISFIACLDGKGVEAGSYTGQIRLSGPPGLGRATVSVTVNAKSGFWFALGLTIALLAAAALLVFRTKRAGGAFDGDFYGEGAVSLIAAGLAMYGVYRQDPAWGADGFGSVLALAGAGLSAAGLKTFIEAVRKSV